MLRCTKIDVVYRVGRVRASVLQDVSLQVAAEPVALMGPSGSGKSSLLRVLAGTQEPQSGTVDIDGKAVRAGRDRGTTDSRVALIQQDHRLVEFLTVEENLRLAAELRGLRLAGADMARQLAAVGLDGFSARWPLTLSGGEQQRVAIARALLLGSRVILADEPTGSLDVDNSLRVAELLAEVAQREGIYVVVATHDPDVAALLPRNVRLARGRIEEQPA
jgi:ABC-type lipoprotein export system ATPase subunit